MLKKKIVFFGNTCYACCDGNCAKAWGICARPTVKEGNTIFMVSDTMFDKAPDDPGTYEGCDGKPEIKGSQDMNKWCVRQCERCTIFDSEEEIEESKLPSFKELVYKYEDTE